MDTPSAAEEYPLELERVSPGLELEGDSSGSELDRESPDSELDRDSQWLQTLSEPELDFVIGLKELAVTQTQSAAHPDLSRRFHLRTLRALSVVLLEHFKDRLKQPSCDGLALLRDVPNAEGYQDQPKQISSEGLLLLRDVPNAEGYQDQPTPNVPNAEGFQDPPTPNVPNAEGFQDQPTPNVPNAEGYQDQPMPNGVNMKRKQLQHGSGEESSSNKRKIERELGDGKTTSC